MSQLDDIQEKHGRGAGPSSARLVKRDLGRRHYEVTLDGRSYEVVHHVRDELWRVFNSRGTSIGEYTPRGCRIVSLCQQEFERLEPVE